MIPSEGVGWAGHVLELTGWTLVYVAAARISALLALPPGNVSPVWLPSGIMLAAVLRRGLRLWPAVFLGGFLGNALLYLEPASGRELAMGLLAGSANGLAEVASYIGGGWLILRGTREPFSLSRIGDLKRFLLYGAALGPLASACIGVGTQSALGFIPAERIELSLLTWFGGDAVGVLVITPLLLSWGDGETVSPEGVRRWTGYLYPVLVVAFAGYLMQQKVGFCLFCDLEGRSLVVPPIVLMPLLVWEVFTQRGSTVFLSAVGVSTVLLTATLAGIGPFNLELEEVAASLIRLDWFLVTLHVTLLIVFTLVMENRRGRQEVERVNRGLEERIRERTRELRREIAARAETEQQQEGAIRKLKAAIEEVKTLRGMLPICSFCKKVRDDQGYWEQVDVYIDKHLGGQVTHGICPDCMRKYYPGIRPGPTGSQE